MYSEHFQTFKIESFAKKNNVWVQLSNQKIFRGMGQDGVVEIGHFHKHIFKNMWIALATTQSVREHLTTQLSWAAVLLLVTCGSLVFQVVGVKSLCSMVPYGCVNGGSVDVFCHMVSMVLLMGSWCYSRKWV